MRAFFWLVGSVTVLNIVLRVGLMLDVLWYVPIDPAAEISCIATLALVLGSAVHYARRRTLLPPRPLVCLAVALVCAPALAIALAGPALALGGIGPLFNLCLVGLAALGVPPPDSLAFETAFVLFQAVGLWVVGGVLFGGPFTCPDGHVPEELPEHQVAVRDGGRLDG
ncbi:hypothetical protein [Nannocystis sp. SCPEA4]|uniref:hypothetical protein n=1 Tax=Nannocystis sp. SCPEA4 TaxID=2996787 RepID=UPI0022710CDC|nr:hypothetical protein [Nannocystis sp. SCPEA4]MCY1060747.1 hypothetical protein [Nannocystis sp. SCPEA4]